MGLLDRWSEANEKTMENREGQRVPEVTFRVQQDGRWRNLTTAEVFAGKTVIVFSLPGAFTPTCSTAHVPRYEELASRFHARGVDTIACVSVNDTFVMNAWREAEGAEHILFLPDGNAEFTRGMGMLVDKSDLGFGPRSWRYSMLVRDGVIEKMFIEPEQPGDPYEVSDADTMLGWLDPTGAPPHEIAMLTRPGCTHCARARAMLAERGLAWEEIPSTPRRLRAIAGRETTPQVFVDGRLIGGADELAAWLGGGAR